MTPQGLTRGHTFAAGAVSMLLVSQWLVVAVAFAAGVLCTLALVYGRRIGAELVRLYRAWRARRGLVSGPLPKRGSPLRRGVR